MVLKTFFSIAVQFFSYSILAILIVHLATCYWLPACFKPGISSIPFFPLVNSLFLSLPFDLSLFLSLPTSLPFDLLLFLCLPPVLSPSGISLNESFSLMVLSKRLIHRLNALASLRAHPCRCLCFCPHPRRSTLWFASSLEVKLDGFVFIIIIILAEVSEFSFFLLAADMSELFLLWFHSACVRQPLWGDERRRPPTFWSVTQGFDSRMENSTLHMCRERRERRGVVYVCLSLC